MRVLGGGLQPMCQGEFVEVRGGLSNFPDEVFPFLLQLFERRNDCDLLSLFPRPFFQLRAQYLEVPAVAHHRLKRTHFPRPMLCGWFQHGLSRLDDISHLLESNAHLMQRLLICWP